MMKLFISEVHRRNHMWDRENLHYKDMALLDAEWETISQMTGFSKEDARRKWKSLRDQFKKELKKVMNSESLSNDEVLELYTGKWVYFPMLLFLRENIEGTISENIREEEVIIKNEIHYIDCDSNDAEDNLMITTTTKPATVVAVTSNKDHDLRQHRNKPRIVEKKRRARITPTLPGYGDPELDSDLLFLKSLLPYFKKISPVRQLHVRNKIQDILLEEMSTSGHYN